MLWRSPWPAVFLLSVLVVAWTAVPTEAQRLGSCADPAFSLAIGPGGEVDDPRPLRVLVHEAEVYPHPESSTPTMTLGFNEIVYAERYADHSGPWIEVLPIDAQSPVGWVRGDQLLCTSLALKDPGTRLERKLFIDTEETVVVNAYTGPDQANCNGPCRTLSRFQLYFVFAQDGARGRYLISSDVTLTEARNLVGWVDQDSGIVWNTAFGARPDDDAQELMAWSSFDKAHTQSDPDVVLQGGAQWYDIAIHPPVLKRERDGGREFYRISAPGVGIVGFEAVKTEALESLKDVDVFFLLDATNSMKDHLRSAQRTAREIADLLVNDPRYGESSFRFGFRVYRDEFAGKRGIGEASLYSKSNCHGDRVEDNRSAFETALNGVQFSREQNDKTYTENLFIGLQQAFLDMARCPSRTKILFVISDAGDHQEQISDGVIRGLDGYEKPPLIFFIQPDFRPEGKRNPGDYETAYDRYRDQALALTGELLEKLDSQQLGAELSAQDHLFTLSADQLAESIVDTVSLYSRSDTINEIIQRLRNGQSLEAILGQMAKEGDYPLLYLELIHSAACEELGDHCTIRVEHGVADFLVPTTEPGWQEEVWLSQYQLDRWISLLSSLASAGREETGSRKRQRFIEALTEQLETFVGEPSLPDSGEEIGDFLERRADLPVRPTSPLFQYELEEIETVIENCELNRLIEWASSVRKVLAGISANPSVAPRFRLREYPSSICTSISPKGARILEMVAEEPVSLGTHPDTSEPYSFRSIFREEIRYWLPIEYLP